MFHGADSRISAKNLHVPLRSVENTLDRPAGQGNNRVAMNGTLPHNNCTYATKIRTDPLSDSYNTEEEIGRGKFAVVKLCRHKHSGLKYAAKFLRKRRKGKDCRHEIIHEIQMLEMARQHPRLVDLVEVYETSHELILVTEYASGGELHQYVCDFMDEEDKMKEQDVIRLMRQLLQGLVFLHDKNIVHLDVKPQNILLTKTLPHGDIKLCDFGFARRVNSGEDIRDILGTPDYVAPEVLSYEPINTACDMWSMGVLVYVMLTGCSPFAGDTKQETFLNISQVNLDFPEELFAHISTEAQEFMAKLLVRDPADRLTARECLSHAWIQNSDIPAAPLPVRSPFGSPIGCRRALTPPSPDGSLEVEPSKKCKCDDQSDDHSVEPKETELKKDDSVSDHATAVDCSDVNRVRDEVPNEVCTGHDSQGQTTVQSCTREQGLVIVSNGIESSHTDSVMVNKDCSPQKNECRTCEEKRCIQDNSCTSHLQNMEQQLAY